jgi:hypothetical protein
MEHIDTRYRFDKFKLDDKKMSENKYAKQNQLEIENHKLKEENQALKQVLLKRTEEANKALLQSSEENSYLATLLQDKMPNSPSLLHKIPSSTNVDDIQTTLSALQEQIAKLEEGMAAQTAKINLLLAENSKIKQHLQKSLK